MIILTGNFEQLTGASTGYVTVALANYGGYVATVSGTGIVVGTSITSVLGSSFSVSLYGNDAITPSGTYYTVTFYNLVGTAIASLNYQFTGSSTIDLSTYSPMTTTLAAYSGNPVVTNPLGSQTINGALTITGETTVPTPANPTDAATKSYVDTGLGTKQNLLGFTPENAAHKGAANGYAPLDANGLLPTTNLPPLAIGDVFTAASQSAMLALAAHQGDVAVRTDISETFILVNNTPSLLANWVQILTPPGVTSVALSAPSEFTVSGSPVTTTGTLTFSKANQNANYVWAGPTSGSPAAPTFRALVANDIPSLPYLGSGTVLPSTASATGSKWLNSYTASTGAFTESQPTFTDLAAHPTSIAGYGITDTLTNTVFGRSGTVTAQSGDYSVGQVTGAAPYPGAGIPNSTGSAWGTSYTTTGSGTVVALATSPVFTTPSLGAATATSITGLTAATTPNAAGGTTIGSAALPFSSIYIGAAATNNIQLTGTATGARTATFPDATTKIPVIPQTITVSGPTAARTWTVPDASFTVARTDAANTFTGTQVFSSAPTMPGFATATAGTGTVGSATNWVNSIYMGTGASYYGQLTGTPTANRTWTLPNANTSIPIASYTHTITGPTAGRTFTFPDASISVARTDAAQTFTGTQTFSTVNATSAYQVNGASPTATNLLTGVTGSASSSTYLRGDNTWATVATGGITLENNGTSNSSQSILNLVSGSNITITDGGSGNITIAGGSSMAWPAATGIAVYGGSNAWGTAISWNSGTSTATMNITGNAGGTANAATYVVNSGAGNAQFIWSGQTTTPTYFWGTTNGTQFYPYVVADMTVGNSSTCCGQALGTGNSPTFANVYATGDVYSSYSDIRLKKDLEPIADWKTIIDGVSGYRFKWNDIGKKLVTSTNEVEVGLVAQEVEKVLPQAVSIHGAKQVDKDGTPMKTANDLDNPYLTVKPEKLVPVLVEAVKYLMKKVEELENGRS